MKLMLLSLVFSQLLWAAPSSENKKLSGFYNVISCSPECSRLIIGLETLDAFKELNVTILDKIEGASTCDGKDPFEFNIRLYKKNVVPVFYNNLNASESHGTKAICDADFSVTDSSVSLSNSSGLKIIMKQKSEGLYTLLWIDPIRTIKAQLDLKKRL